MTTANAPGQMPTQDIDPDVIAAREAQETYIKTIQAARASWGVETELEKAEKIAAAYATYIKTLQDHWEALQDRRRERLEYLETLVPVGPGIPEGTTPADRTVLLAAFRTAYEKASGVSAAGRAEMMADAERFDDDAARRGTMTAMMEFGDMHQVQAWTDRHLPLAGYLDEVQELRAAFAGQSFNPDHRLAWQAFTAQRIPDEARPDNLTRLRNLDRIARTGPR